MGRESGKGTKNVGGEKREEVEVVSRGEAELKGVFDC